MAFLDNSGDIILDAVLTDTGRYRLAKADGSFRIAKFALGDDEINYRLYDKNNPSGSAYYDLNILQTPILEAFTNNSISLKSKLITISRNDYLYMPILKLNTVPQPNKMSINAGFGQNTFLVSVDNTTQNQIGNIDGHIHGVDLADTANSSTVIRVDQGIDSPDISPAFGIYSDQKETQYIVEIDNRLGSIFINGREASMSYLDDDQIASYFFSSGTDTTYIANIGIPTDTSTIAAMMTDQVIRGPRGTYINFKIKTSTDLGTSTFLFDQMGSILTVSGKDYFYLDSTVRVIGATTGYRLDIPIRFLKAKIV